MGEGPSRKTRREATAVVGRQVSGWTRGAGVDGDKQRDSGALWKWNWQDLAMANWSRRRKLRAQV